MYGVVVMVALSTTVEAPDFGRRGGCHGCCGGYSCCGGGYSCGGYSCSGWGGGCHGMAYRSYGGCCGGGGYWSGGSGYMNMPRADVYPGGTIIGEARYPGTVVREAGYYEPADTSAATITIQVPSGRLMIDDYTVPSPGDRHTYVTGPIPANQTRTITFKTEVMKDGRMQPMTKQVTVKPGQKATVEFVTSGSPPPR